MSGRGHLSSMEMLPDEAADDVVWACRELAARKRTLEDIRFEFNNRLEAKGIEGISKSAFQRRAARLWAAQRRMHDARAMFEGLASQFTAADVDENTIVLGEFIKTLIQELIEDQAGDRTPKQAMELARAFQATVSAQKISADRRRQLEDDMKARLVRAVDQVEAEVSKASTVPSSREVLRMIREDVYGMFEK